MAEFEVSAMNLAAMVRALQPGGLLEPVRAQLKPATAAAIDNPHGSRWHPGDVAVDLWETIVRVHGPERLEAMNLKLTADSFGPVVRPLVMVALALGGRSPATVFSRLGDASKVATRGVEVTWEPDGPSAGRVSFAYGREMPPVVVEYGWRGVMRFGEELTGKIFAFRFEPQSDRRFVFHVSW